MPSLELTVALLSDQAGLPEVAPIDDTAIDGVLAAGAVELLGRMPWSSNATFIARVGDGDGQVLAIYKPQRGERPLWDFPEGTLCLREVAAAEISERLGWDLVPRTVLRDDLPHGLGSLQRFVDHDPEDHYFTMLEAHADEFRRFAVFDIVVNNTDRKGGHLLRAATGEIIGIDHGVCFHPQWKLRTVIWEFGGDEIAEPLLADLERLVDTLTAGDPIIETLLSPIEIAAVRGRAEHLLEARRYPLPGDDHRHYPWPLV